MNKQQILEEIETQWECHVMTRAVFDANFPNRGSEYSSGSFYKEHGIHFKVHILNTESNQFKRSSKRVAEWLNQNYVIRLFGILDGHRLIKCGVFLESDVIKLLKLLRNNVGAHSTGTKPSDKTSIRRAKKLIKKLFDRSISDESVEYYTLSIDSILFPMKERIKEFIRDLDFEQQKSPE
jgi:hypothetical protein